MGLTKGHEDYPGKAPRCPRIPPRWKSEKAQGAIKTDFILSAEIMTISLAAIPPSSFWMEVATLAAVAVIITVAVYGAVALIVKMDDLGLLMANKGRLSAATRFWARMLVKGMPGFLHLLTIVGLCPVAARGQGHRERMRQRLRHPSHP